MKKQKGLTLTSMLLVGIMIILGIVYGRHIINIYYNNYSLSTKVQSIIKEVNTNTDNKQILKLLREKAAIDKLDTLYDDNDVLIEKTTTSIRISIVYRECANLAKDWEVCTDQTIESK